MGFLSEYCREKDMSKIAGRVIDKNTGESLEARVHVEIVEERFMHPKNAILKVFEVDVPWGTTQIMVERGTEYVPARLSVNVPVHGTATVDVELERWSYLSEQGWHPGNTHIHYDQFETNPDERLRLDPKVEDLRVTAVSIVKRGDRDYAVNKYTPGVLTEFCSAHHHVECGEESRHNNREDSLDKGYGHIMLLRLQEAIVPVSRGYLVDETDPDYPPLCYACDDAHRQGGIVIWCHNGRGMEAPVAAALGKLDAFNLFDPHWMDPEYAIWYAMLNCGLRLPASTGSDWFICSANRVYAYTGRSFNYHDWMQSLQEGRTFITNGPSLFLSADDQMPGETLVREPGQEIFAVASWKSHYSIHRVEIIWNGHVIATQQFPDGSMEGNFEAGIKAYSDGWVAARLSSTARDSFFQPIYAHTSPVYVTAGLQPAETAAAAAQFECAIQRALGRVNTRYRFEHDRQRREVVELFRRGQAVFRKLIA
jgi:hypothetical protein